MSLARIVAPKRLTEGTVITESLVTTAIEDERKWFEEEKRETEADGAAYKIKWDAVDLRKADTVVLSYSRIRAIDNLSALDALVKLRLDNNDIETIAGLDTLVNLRELDLSFNRITAIAGLNKLAHLTDLSLYSNRISKLDSLDAQAGTLASLSLGRNALSAQMDVVYLRRFPHLRLLCLEGNPLASADPAEYRGSSVALLPQLRYLDWTLITDVERKAAQETHHRLISDLADMASPTAAAGSAAAASGGMNGGEGALEGSPSAPALHAGGGAAGGGAPGAGDALAASNALAVREAGLHYVAAVWSILLDVRNSASAAAALGGDGDVTARSSGGGAHSAAAMLRDDGGSPRRDGDDETSAVLRIPGMADRMATYKESIDALVEQAVTRGLASHADIMKEVVAAEYVLNSYVAASDARAKALIDDYTGTRKRLLRSAEEGHHTARAELPSPDGADAGPRAHRHHHARGDGDASVSENSEIAAAEAALEALEQLRDENEVLHTRLVGIETVLHEQAVAVLTEFDAAWAELGSKRGELFQKFFRAVEKEEMASSEDCKTIVMNEVERFQEHVALSSALQAGGGATTAAASASSKPARKGSEADDADTSPRAGASNSGMDMELLDEDVAALLADREGALVAASNMHDAHIARLLAAEDKTRMNERDRERKQVKSRMVAECDRHRERMHEINTLHSRNAADIDAMVLVEQHTLAELHGDV